MLLIDVGYHGNGRRKFQKGAVTFVRFGHNKIALSENGIGADTFQFSADHHCWVQAAFCQDGSDDRSGRCFAMGAGNRNAVLQAHQFSQHFCPWNYRNRRLAGRLDFRIFRIDGRRNHHHIGTFNMLGRMLFKYCAPQAFEAVGNIRFFDVGTRYLVAQVQQQLSNTAHADAADAHKMNMVFFKVHNI